MVKDRFDGRPGISIQPLPSSIANQGHDGYLNQRPKDEKPRAIDAIYENIKAKERHIQQSDMERAKASSITDFLFDKSPNQYKNPKEKAFNLQTKDSSLIDMKIIEKWINETLKEAKYYEIKPAIQKLSNALCPMQDYGIDRMTL